MPKLPGLTILLFTILFSCGLPVRTAVTEEQANWVNNDRSHVRNLRFRQLGEGNTVTLYFRPHTWKEIEILPGYYIVSNAIDEFRQDHVVFREVNFPFRATLRYEIQVYEGSGKPYPKFCEFSFEIRKQGSWDIYVYH